MVTDTILPQTYAPLRGIKDSSLSVALERSASVGPANAKVVSTACKTHMQLSYLSRLAFGHTWLEAGGTAALVADGLHSTPAEKSCQTPSIEGRAMQYHLTSLETPCAGEARPALFTGLAITLSCRHSISRSVCFRARLGALDSAAARLRRVDSGRFVPTMSRASRGRLSRESQVEAAFFVVPDWNLSQTAR